MSLLLTDYVDQLCDEYSFAPGISFNLNLVLEEAVSNVVLYAYPDGKEHHITLDAAWNDQERQLSLVLKDHGLPFNPLEEAPEVDTTLDANERSIGGLGIFLIRQMMDEVTYERIDGYNILTMRKNIS